MTDRDPFDEDGDPLSPETLIFAYSNGIFPMGEAGSDEVSWYRPDPRAILPLDALHVPRRLARTMRAKLGSGELEVTFDRAFEDVVRGCAEGRPVWITESFVRAYAQLHALGYAHSVEVWRDGSLVGGTYGVQLGGAFMAESKFRRETDASKIALVALARHLLERGFSLLEIQFLTEHLAQFGAIEVPLSVYLRRLRVAMRRPCTY